MSRRYLLARRLMLALFIATTAGYLGIVSESTGIKVLSAACQIVMLVLSIDVLKRYRRFIQWRRALILLGIMCAYPLIRIAFEVAAQFTFKNFTDAFFIMGGYYQLGIAGLAMAVLTRDGEGFPLLYRFAFYAIPVGLLLLAFGLKADQETTIGMGQLAINNCFIPVAMLALYPSKKKTLFLGWFAIGMIVLDASRIWSRSYTLLGCYLAAMAIWAFFRTGNRKLGYAFIILIITAYFSGAFSFFQQKSVSGQSSVADKYQFSSMENTMEQFLQDGNLVKLFFWEGNSRAGIIVDAFAQFNNSNWWLGKGIFGKYESFVERSTIEIGWAQDLFRWGIPYIVLTLGVMLYARRRLKKSPAALQDVMVRPLAALILIKFLDGFVYGMPYNTVYNAMVFWAIMRTAVIYLPKPTVHVSKELEPAIAEPAIA